MSTINRGDYLMNKAAEALKEQGYFVEKAKKVRWQQQDFWGCWDIIAIREGSIKFIQVSAKPPYDRGTEYKLKLVSFPTICPHAKKEYWWWNKTGPAKGWRIANI